MITKLIYSRETGSSSVSEKVDKFEAAKAISAPKSKKHKRMVITRETVDAPIPARTPPQLPTPAPPAIQPPVQAAPFVSFKANPCAPGFSQDQLPDFL